MVFLLWQVRIWRSRSRAAPAGGRLPLRGRWTGRSPGRMRGITLSWERVAGRSPDGCGAVPGRTWYRLPTFRNRAFGPNRSGDAPFRRLLAAPTARSVHPGPPERLGFSPHPSGPMALPPSPAGKASSGGGYQILIFLSPCIVEEYVLSQSGTAQPPGCWKCR